MSDRIEYSHEHNSHSLLSPAVVIPLLFQQKRPSSLLDVGCGCGTWIKAAMDFGINDFVGVDGVDLRPELLLFPFEKFVRRSLEKPWDLGRRFDVSICLEVAEHIPETCAGALIDTLVRHSDVIVFSAASPGQPGQHHVNCQWPQYWQKLFNSREYECKDEIRWKIWNDSRVEPWYRQNMFVATHNPKSAGKEARILPVRHPDGWWWNNRDHYVNQIEEGLMPAAWYLRAPFLALGKKILRKASGRLKR